METRAEAKFSEFYEKWIAELEDHLRHLLVAPLRPSQEAEFKTVIDKLTTHHRNYYKSKWALAHDDVLPFFSPSWLTPLENAYLWITGWKPSTAFRLVDPLKKTRSESGSSISGLSEEQERGIEGLRGRVKAEEERVEREMERLQVAMADRKMVELARLDAAARGRGEEGAAVGAAVKGVVEGLEKVMKMADCVRLKTMKGVLEVLTPVQCVQFLAATAMLQIQMRRWGRSRGKSSSCIEIEDEK